MRNLLGSFLALFLAFSFVTLISAEDKKEEKKDEKKVTLKGEIACPKCVFELKGYTKCANAIKVKEDGKDVYYILDDKGGEETYHKECCTEAKKGKVTGVVTKKGDKKMIKPVKDGVKFD